MATSRGLLVLATGERLQDTKIEPGLGQGSVPGNVTPGRCLPGGNQSPAFPDTGEAKRAGTARQQSAQGRDSGSCRRVRAPLGMVRTPLLHGPIHLCGRLCLPGGCEVVCGSRWIPWVFVFPEPSSKVPWVIRVLLLQVCARA